MSAGSRASRGGSWFLRRFRCWSLAALAVGLAGCVTEAATPEIADSGIRRDDDIIDIPPASPPVASPPTKTVEPIQVIDQPSLLDASYPDAAFDYAAPPEPDACATSEFPAERLPLDAYIMLDRSGSMNLPEALPPFVEGDCDVGDEKTSRWCHTLNALDGFFATPSSEGMGVALQFFPNGDCGVVSPVQDTCCAGGACCAGTADAIPAVSLGLLAEHRELLVDALNQQSPAGTTTPIEPALRGMSTWTAANKAPLRSMVGILITDGAPEGCNESQQALANIAAAHLRKTGIPTFVLGMDGADFRPLNQIAEAGGTVRHTDHCPGGYADGCYAYNVSSGDPGALVDALEQIKGAVVQCRYLMPTTNQGVIDPRRVSVVYETTGGDVRLKQVSGADACTQSGFYYDDPSAPTELLLCPQACSALRSRQASQIRVAVECLGI